MFVITEPRQGAASARIKTSRRLFPCVFFNEDTTEEGHEALGWDHEKKSTDPERDIGLGPNHDWSSHAADAFGLMCIHYDQPDGAPPRPNDTAAAAAQAVAVPGKARRLRAGSSRQPHAAPARNRNPAYLSAFFSDERTCANSNGKRPPDCLGLPEQTGQIENPDFTSRFLLIAVDHLISLGERRRLALANLAITAYERLDRSGLAA